MSVESDMVKEDKELKRLLIAAMIMSSLRSSNCYGEDRDGLVTTSIMDAAALIKANAEFKE